ncbi:MAG: hypothetical protein VX938_08775, partial [Myxococcota bacterium]|nr:hypothetical protein [Myxococcota bacterium]
VANNGYANASTVSALTDSLATVATTGSFNDLADVPPGLTDGDADTLANLPCTDGQAPTYNEGEASWTCSDSIGGGGGGGGNGGTVVTTRCTWVGSAGTSVDECTPPDCPDEWTNLGVTGNVKLGSADSGQAPISNSSYTTAYGYQERSCYHSGRFAVVVTRCAWVGSAGTSVNECTPPDCPDAWTDIGVTGNVKTNAVASGQAPISNSSYTTSSGYQERTCVF